MQSIGERICRLEVAVGPASGQGEGAELLLHRVERLEQQLGGLADGPLDLWGLARRLEAAAKHTAMLERAFNCQQETIIGQQAEIAQLRVSVEKMETITMGAVPPSPPPPPPPPPPPLLAGRVAKMLGPAMVTRTTARRPPQHATVDGLLALSNPNYFAQPNPSCSREAAEAWRLAARHDAIGCRDGDRSAVVAAAVLCECLFAALRHSASLYTRCHSDRRPDGAVLVRAGWPRQFCPAGRQGSTGR